MSYSGKVRAVVLVLVAVVLIASLVFGGSASDEVNLTQYSAGSERIISDGLWVPRVRVALTVPAPEIETRTYYGIVRSASAAPIASTSGGRIVSVPASVGTPVARGELIALLDDRAYTHALARAQAAVEQARAQRLQAERDRERVSSLGDAATAEELELRQTALLASRAAEAEAQSGLNEAQRELDETRIVAPYRGVVTDILVDAGQVVAQGSPVAFISGTGDQYEVELLVEADAVVRLDASGPVRAVFPLSKIPPVSGSVLSVSRHGGTMGALFPVTVILHADDSLGAGHPVAVSLSLAQDRDGVVVPLDAIVGDAAMKPVVFVVHDSSVKAIWPEVVEPTEGGAFIGNAVPANSQVVVSGHATLSDGMRVEVVR